MTDPLLMEIYTYVHYDHKILISYLELRLLMKYILPKNYYPSINMTFF